MDYYKCHEHMNMCRCPGGVILLGRSEQSCW